MRDVPALPVDLFRVLVGLLGVAYFGSLLREVGDFTAPDGLLDHDFLHEVYWFTRLSLFHPGLPPAFFQAALALAGVCAAAVALGVRIKTCAAVCFAVAVSTYRWNFPVMYVDDAIMHLVFFWILLLPVGRTLRITEAWRDGSAALHRWRDVTVPGTAVRCLVGNMCLLYLVAGLWKLESTYWRSGFAMYASVRLPIGRFPDLWGPEHMPILAVLTHWSLLIEPILPVLLLLPKGSPLKWVGLVSQIVFHLGIVATLRIPFANIACIAAVVLFFRDEIMEVVGGHTERKVIYVARSMDLGGRIALVFLLVLCVAMTRRLPPPANALSHEAVVALWTIGMAQDYQLFNWIDKKALHGANTAWISVDGTVRQVDPGDAFPSSLRGALLQSYLHDVRWLRVPEGHRPALKAKIIERMARRLCRRHPEAEAAAVWATVQWITPDNVQLSRGENRLLAEFLCRPADVVLCRSLVAPERNPECPHLGISDLRISDFEFDPQPLPRTR